MKTMLSRTLAALLVAVAALPAVAVHAAETLTVQTFNEKNAPVEVVIPKDPKRVAVLDYAVLDTMDAWGLGNRVTALPKSTALPWLAKYKNDSKIVNTGTPKEVDFEALMASEPDVIFVCDCDSAISRPGARLAQDVMTNPLVERTDAAKNGRIVHLTSSAWYLAEGGLRATDMMFADIEKALGIAK